MSAVKNTSQHRCFQSLCLDQIRPLNRLKIGGAVNQAWCTHAHTVLRVDLIRKQLKAPVWCLIAFSVLAKLDTDPHFVLKSTFKADTTNVFRFFYTGINFMLHMVFPVPHVVVFRQQKERMLFWVFFQLLHGKDEVNHSEKV